MSVKARFYVTEITVNNTEYVRVKLLPSTKGEDNHEWSKYTPSGELWMNVHSSSGAVAEFQKALAEHADFELTFEALVPLSPSAS